MEQLGSQWKNFNYIWPDNYLKIPVNVRKKDKFGKDFVTLIDIVGISTVKARIWRKYCDESQTCSMWGECELG